MLILDLSRMARALKENILLVAQKCLGKPTVGAENRQTILCLLLSSAKKKKKRNPLATVMNNAPNDENFSHLFLNILIR